MQYYMGPYLIDFRTSNETQLFNEDEY